MKTLIAILLATLSLSGATSYAEQPPDAKAEADIMAAMEAWRQAMMKKDGAALERLYHADLSYGHSNGQIETKSEAIQHIVTSKADYAAVDLVDTKVRVQGSFALMTGRVNYKQVTDGKPSDVKLFVLHVWTRGPQGWQMIGRQSTRETAP
jgi:ketosteroid isomerase-like protein